MVFSYKERLKKSPKSWAVHGVGDETTYDTRTWSVFPHMVGICNTLCSISRVTGTLTTHTFIRAVAWSGDLHLFAAGMDCLLIICWELSSWSFQWYGDCTNLEFMAKLSCSVSSLFTAVSRECCSLLFQICLTVILDMNIPRNMLHDMT